MLNNKKQTAELKRIAYALEVQNELKRAELKLIERFHMTLIELINDKSNNIAFAIKTKGGMKK